MPKPDNANGHPKAPAGINRNGDRRLPHRVVRDGTSTSGKAVDSLGSAHQLAVEAGVLLAFASAPVLLAGALLSAATLLAGASVVGFAESAAFSPSVDFAAAGGSVAESPLLGRLSLIYQPEPLNTTPTGPITR